MICDNCNEPKLESDFIKNQKFCYKCEYKKKLRKMRDIERKKEALCRTCAKKIVFKINYKKRQRSTYCSQECADAGHRKLINNHWTRQIKTGAMSPWKINHA